MTAYGFKGRQLEKWYYNKRPAGRIPKSQWLSRAVGLYKLKVENPVDPYIA